MDYPDCSKSNEASGRGLAHIHMDLDIRCDRGYLRHADHIVLQKRNSFPGVFRLEDVVRLLILGADNIR